MDSSSPIAEPDGIGCVVFVVVGVLFLVIAAAVALGVYIGASL